MIAVRNRCFSGLALLALAAAVPLQAWAADAEAPFNPPDSVVVAADTPFLPRFEKRHTGRFNGQQIRYRSVVEETPVTDASGAVVASIGSISYISEGGGDARPVIFAFNGGPGSASVWLHMGFFGPVRPDYGSGDDEIQPPTAAPFAMVPNPESPLDVADVVLIDPPGTGFARVYGKDNTAKVFGPEEDAQVVTRFITEWLRRNGRENSPRYLIGESYGTIRAALVAKMLAGGPFATGRMNGITLNGVMLLGQAMDGSRRSPEISAVKNLSAFAATAWYHGKVARGAGLEAHVEQARAFAAGPYLTALMAGSRLPAAERDAIATTLSGLIGIPAARLLELDLRMDGTTFGRELLRDEGLQVGAYDARYTLPLAASAGDPVADDPAMGQYVPLYVATLQEHMRTNLGVSVDRAYNPIEFHQINSVFWKGQPPLSQNHAESLATAMRRNPQLRVLVGTGYFDLVTTLGAAEDAVALSGMDPERVTMISYTSGHMPYIGKQSRAQLAADVRAFVSGQGR